MRMSGKPTGRPLMWNTRRVATSSSAAAPSPYTVSVGKAMTPPLRISFAARVSPARVGFKTTLRSLAHDRQGRGARGGRRRSDAPPLRPTKGSSNRARPERGRPQSIAPAPRRADGSRAPNHLAPRRGLGRVGRPLLPPGASRPPHMGGSRRRCRTSRSAEPTGPRTPAGPARRANAPPRCARRSRVPPRMCPKQRPPRWARNARGRSRCSRCRSPPPPPASGGPRHRPSPPRPAQAPRRRHSCPPAPRGRQGVGPLVEVPVNKSFRPVERELDPVIRDAVLLEVVGADLLGPAAGADHATALRSDLLLLLRELDLVKTRPQHA